MTVKNANCSLLVSYKCSCTGRGVSEGGGGGGREIFDRFSGRAATGARTWDRYRQAEYEVCVLGILDPSINSVRRIGVIFCKDREGRALGNPRSQNRDPSTGSGQALGHPAIEKNDGLRRETSQLATIQAQPHSRLLGRFSGVIPRLGGFA
jgi:hypothetical protein